MFREDRPTETRGSYPRVNPSPGRPTKRRVALAVHTSSAPRFRRAPETATTTVHQQVCEYVVRRGEDEAGYEVQLVNRVTCHTACAEWFSDLVVSSVPRTNAEETIHSAIEEERLTCYPKPQQHTTGSRSRSRSSSPVFFLLHNKQ